MTRHKEHPSKKKTSEIEALYAESSPAAAPSGPVDDSPADVAATSTGDGAAAEALAKLRGELDAAVAARQRALADFANFQRRSLENEARSRREGMVYVARQLVPVLDSFELALGHNLEQMSVEQLADGVRLVHQTLLKVLAECGMRVIEPEVGEAFDPVMHEAMLHQQAEGVRPNHIVQVFQPGYMLGETVLRPAKVAVAPES